MEQKVGISLHLTMEEIFMLVEKDERTHHLDECAFCQEQYEDAVSLKNFEASLREEE